MSYVDLAWPLGLFFIGVQVFLFSGELTWRSGIIGGLYMFAGGRMSAMALIGLKLGYLNKELPRYEYQRLRWQRRGWRETPALLFEVASQGFANMTVLALPAVLQASNPSPSLSWLEILGYGLWLAAFIFEFIADAQKARFGLRMRREKRKGEHCEDGLWKYSRHPNYFGDALLWWGFYLIACAAGGWWTVFSPMLMTFLLVKVSGVAMLERSLTKTKPEYEAYARRTNAFLPWFPKREV